MSLKRLYRTVIGVFERMPSDIGRAKVFLAEWYAILRKRKLYRDIKWTKEQKEEFDAYWKKKYGRKISPRWHKLYESINGIHNIAYIPEIMYTAYLEPRGNGYLYARAFSDKSLVELFADGVNVKAPRTIVACSGGVYRDGEYHILTEADAQRLLSREAEAVVKPTLGSSSGEGVRIYCREDGKELFVHRLRETFGDDFIVQEKIKPCEAFRRLHPASVNTIRAITYLAKGRVNVAPLCMRIGTGGSSVDNIHRGGAVAYVLKDGMLKGDAFQLGYCDSKKRFRCHPDTGGRIRWLSAPMRA